MISTKNEYGVYIDGEEIVFRGKNCEVLIRLGTNGTRWGHGSRFYSAGPGWGFPLMDRDMVHDSREDARKDAIAMCINNIRDLNNPEKYADMAEILEGLMKPVQMELF